MKPKVFIGSSIESLDIAHAIQANLTHDAETTVWDQDIFIPSKYFLEDLTETVKSAHMGIFVFTPDDILKLRKEDYYTARDNVIFELGMFIAGLGREQTIIVMPHGIENFRIPTDLLGITVTKYDNDRQDKNYKAALAPACIEIKKILSTTLRQRCNYLHNYVESEEPSLVKENSNTRVSYERAYKILLYMFQYEKFQNFYAFDLAFDRWEELLQPDYIQTLNISNEIFDSMNVLFKHERCGSFFRILVISHEQLKRQSSRKVLQYILGQETKWKSEFANLNVETRVFIYPDKSNPNTRRKIRQLHDFALFSGNSEKFAIVETTLTSPTDRVESPECLIVKKDDELQNLEKCFLEFWESSNSISTVIRGMNPVGKCVEETRPMVKAFNKFFVEYPRISDNCSIIIEAGYFDLRYPQDQDRFQHLENAFELLEKMNEKCIKVRNKIHLETFINDFSSINVCNIKYCGDDFSGESNDAKEQAFKNLLSLLEGRYNSHNMTSENFDIFGMRRTRNAVTEVIKKAIKDEKSKVWEQDTNDTTVDICISTYTDDIYLGYRDAGSNRITPRCTAIMAQHYFDLYRSAIRRSPNLKELWIFDFNRLTESEAVRQGAEASFGLYNWPKNIKLCIVNCVYSDDACSGDIHVIEGP